MFEFIELAAAIKIVYQHVQENLTEDDFWPLTTEQHAKLPPHEQSTEWFTINPAKLKQESKESWIVDRNQKSMVLQAIDFIIKLSKDLPENSSLLERLLYVKKALPPVLFTHIS